VGWIDVGETEILRLLYLPDGEHLLTGEGDGRVRLWHVASGTEAASFNTGSEPVQKLVISADGSRFAVAGPGSHFQVWDIASASLLNWIRFGDSKVVDLAFLDNQRLLVLGVDQSIRRYRLPR
jgi:WD40 repeat protein